MRIDEKICLNEHIKERKGVQKMRNWLIYMSVTLVAIVLVACGSNEKEKAQELPIESEIEEVEISDEEIVSDEDVVLEVDGEEIKGDEYNRTYKQTKIFLNSMNEDISDLEDIKEKTLETIVHQTLLVQDAVSKGIDVTDDEFNEEFAEITDGNEDALALYLDQYQMTEEGYKEQLRYSMIYRKYVDQEFSGPEVTDEEVESVYEDLKEANDNISPLSDIREDLKQEIINQHVREEVTEHIDNLKDEADIIEHI